MSRVRLLLAWLIMVALPLQGIAAVSMLYCNGAHHMAGQKQSQPTHQVSSSDEHDHSKHSHATAAQAEKLDDTAKGLPDAAHMCGACASCCNGSAIAALEGWPHFAPLPQIGSTEPFVLIYAAPSQLPDKPPRA